MEKTEITLEAKIEGLLFYKNEDISISELSKILKVNEEEIKHALNNLSHELEHRGVSLLRKDDSVMLGINHELSELVGSMRKEEINKDLSKASLETLSIILYKNGVSRSEIDYIRGVNSSFILRNLLIRGLIEKITDKNDSRKIIYRPTFDTLSFMGITEINQLPNYENVKSQLDSAINNQKENTNE